MTRKEAKPYIKIAREAVLSNPQHAMEHLLTAAEFVAGIQIADVSMIGRSQFLEVQNDFRQLVAAKDVPEGIPWTARKFLTFLEMETRPESPRDWLDNALWRLDSWRGIRSEIAPMRSHLKMLARNFFGADSSYIKEIEEIPFVAPADAARVYSNKEYDNDDALRDGHSLLRSIVEVMIADLEINESKVLWESSTSNADQFETKVDAYFILHPEREFETFSHEEQANAGRMLDDWESILSAMSEQNTITTDQLALLSRELERLRSGIATTRKGRFFRGVAKVASAIDVISKHPVVQQLFVKFMEGQLPNVPLLH